MRSEVLVPESAMGIDYAARLSMSPKREENTHRKIQHAFAEYSQGLIFMANERETSAEMAALVDRLTAAMYAQAETNAQAKIKPKMHPLLMAVAGTLFAMIVGALITYGALQQRVATLEARTQNIERLNSIDANLESLRQSFSSLETRFNAMMDQRKDKQ